MPSIRRSAWTAAVLLAAAPAAPLLAGEALRSPEEFLGFRVGEDRKLARYDQVAGYFHLVDRGSDRVEVVELGKTTEGNPFLMALVSSPESLARQDEIREAQGRLRDPRKGPAGEADRIAERQPLVIAISNNIHSTEIASSQMVMNVLHRLASEDSPEVREILDNLFLLLVPSLNPDGQIKVVDWYRRHVGTEREAGEMPWLYHRYAGHDNNRDAFMLALQETRLFTEVLYRRWFPVVLCDHHQMGQRGPRMFIPPYKDPINPSVDPVIWREIALLGSAMAMDLEAAGKAGVVHGHAFDAYWVGGTRITPLYHNVVGILTETASARIATPYTVRPRPDREGRRAPGGAEPSGEAEEERRERREPPAGWAGPTVQNPNPWKGTTWHLGDIVELQEIATYALLRTAARHRVELNRNYLAMNRRAIERGSKEPPFAFLVPPSQRDPGAARRMLDALARAGVEVVRAAEPFEAGERKHPAGTAAVLLAQPSRAYVKELLDLQRYEEGSPGTREGERFYDITGWSLPLQMGVEAVKIEKPFTARWEPLDPAGFGHVLVEESQRGWLLGREDTGAYAAVNRLLGEGVPVGVLPEAVEDGGRWWAAGTFHVGPAAREQVERIASSLRLEFRAAGDLLAEVVVPLRAPRLALYRPWQANMDEGWTRLVLEMFDFPFETFHNADLRAGGIGGRIDVLVIPSMEERALVRGRTGETVEEAHRGGIGEEGVRALGEFVREGGTVIGLGAAADALVKRFALPLRNVTAGLERGRLSCPGSIVGLQVDPLHPLAFGCRGEIDVFFSGSPAFETTAAFPSHETAVAGKFPESGVLRSGWLRGEEVLSGRVALAEIRHGRGRFVLLAPRVQHRAQAHGTFRLLFNAILMGGG